jgi:hypothetical protein
MYSMNEFLKGCKAREAGRQRFLESEPILAHANRTPKPKCGAGTVFLAAELPCGAEVSAWDQTTVLNCCIPLRCLLLRVRSHQHLHKEFKPALSQAAYRLCRVLVPHCIGGKGIAAASRSFGIQTCACSFSHCIDQPSYRRLDRLCNFLRRG